MATSFSSIYRKFLGMIDDHELSLVSDEDLQEILWGYLDKARSLYFWQCEKDLEQVEEFLGEGEFLETLTSQEQHILALGMKKAWLSSKLNNADLMTRAIGDRDYATVQGHQYIREMMALDKLIEDEIHRYAVIYTYRNLNLVEW